MRIYTNQINPAWGGLSFKSLIPVWNDRGDTAEIRNIKGAVVARYAYGTAAK
ncbi:hypothetical protein [Streptomyces sp. NPDC059080]|uniref:hypothetical protein n=1 Tax=Streptomyces sp. NPDC059080 TaxID=3346718 RepID=UPI00367F274F